MPRKLGIAAARAALEAGGGVVLVTHPDPMKPSDRRRYAIHPQGREMTEVAFLALRPHLEPQPDGLFGTEGSQTFVLRRTRA